MHAYDHGVAMHIITAVVKLLHQLESDLSLSKNTLLSKLTARMHNLCISLEAKHITLLWFTHQSIVSLFETLSTPNKKGQKQSPIVDAGDVQKLMLVLPYLLDGLADEVIEHHNSGYVFLEYGLYESACIKFVSCTYPNNPVSIWSVSTCMCMLITLPGVLLPATFVILSPTRSWLSTSGCTGTTCTATLSQTMMTWTGSLALGGPSSAPSSVCFPFKSR